MLLAAPVAQFPSLFVALAPQLRQRHHRHRRRQHQAGRDRRGARGVRARDLPRFVPGHPIAGTEHTGAAAAFPSLFDGRNVILTPLPETAPAATRADRRAVADVRRARDHARARRGTTRSSRPCRTCRTCSRSRWWPSLRRVRTPPPISTTRRAAFATSRASRRGSPEMWRDIALANRDALLAEIDGYGDALRRGARDDRGRRRRGARRAVRAKRAPRAARGKRGARSRWSRTRADRPVATDFPPQLTLAPARARGRRRRAAGLEEHQQSHAAARGAGARHDDAHRPARIRRHEGDARRAARARHRVARPRRAIATRSRARAARFRSRRPTCYLGLSGLSMRTLVAALAFSGGHYRATACRACASGRSATSSTRCGRWAPTSAYELSAGLSAAADRPGHARAAAPVRIRGDVSSQFLTGLLQALPLLRADVTVHVEGELISRPYVEITLNLMRRFGVDGRARRLARRSACRPGDGYREPGHARASRATRPARRTSSPRASLGGGPVRVTGVGRDSIQGDVAFADELARLGADVRFGPRLDRDARRQRRLRGGTIDCVAIPDAAMTLADRRAVRRRVRPRSPTSAAGG